MIIEKLMEIYNGSKLNAEKPKCIFAETLVFNEGWLLRGILERWRKCELTTKFPFLPFPDNIKIYSEAQLRTPFKKRSQDDNQGEGHTHVDGIVGDFSINGTKSGVVLNRDCRYLAVFEAKMYSGLSDRVKNVADYSQVSRTLACIVNSALETSLSSIHFIVAYPKNNVKIEPARYNKSCVKKEIEKRLDGYKQTDLANRADKRFSAFEKQWRSVLRNINVEFITWEDVLEEFGDKDIMKFYKLCKKYNRECKS